jgi:predicted dehydrogenase
MEVHGTLDPLSRWNGDPFNNDGWGSDIAIPLAVGLSKAAHRCTHEETEVLPLRRNKVIAHRYMNGTNGSAMVNNWQENAKIVCCKNWDEKDVVPVVTAAGLTKTMAPRNENTVTTSELARPDSDVHDFYRNLAAAIDGEVEQVVTHAQVMRVMKVMEAAFASDAAGAPVKLEGDEIAKYQMVY